MVVLLDIDFRIENARRISFNKKKWPVSSISTDELVDAGFFYYPISLHNCCRCKQGYTINIADRVRCFCCGIQLVDWMEGDIPSVEHRKWSPSCDFISFNVDDVPIAEWTPSQDYLKRMNTEIMNSEDGIRQRTNSEEDRHQKKMVVPPDFSIENVRIKSFEGWPVTFISVANLAISGFYYTPRSFDVCGNMESIIDDRVRCFCCGIELAKWEVGDDPIVVHRKWSPSCEFIQKF